MLLEKPLCDSERRIWDTFDPSSFQDIPTIRHAALRHLVIGAEVPAKRDLLICHAPPGFRKGILTLIVVGE